MIEINRKPSNRELGWFGLIVLVFFGVVGAIAFFKFSAATVAYVLWSVGAGLTLLFYAIRPIRGPFYLAWMRLFFPIGWTVSTGVLVVLYYGVVTPIALLMRIVRYDPMKRRPDPTATSYWTEHRTGGDPSRYLRQF